MEEPSAVELSARFAVAASIETIVLFFILLLALSALRRMMDLTFPDGPSFYRGVLVVAAAAAVLWMVPVVGWILALAAVVALVMKLFDGDLLAGCYVALALWGAHGLLNLVLLAKLRGGR